MSAGKIISEGYKNHVAELQQHWERALQAENYDAALIHAGSKLASFLDDYEYPFRCKPHFLWWLPLTHTTIVHCWCARGAVQNCFTTNRMITGIHRRQTRNHGGPMNLKLYRFVMWMPGSKLESMSGQLA